MIWEYTPISGTPVDEPKLGMLSVGRTTIHSGDRNCKPISYLWGPQAKSEIHYRISIYPLIIEKIWQLACIEKLWWFTYFLSMVMFRGYAKL